MIKKKKKIWKKFRQKSRKPYIWYRGPTNYYLLADKQKAIPKGPSPNKKILKSLLGRSQENGPVGRKREDRKSNGSRQKKSSMEGGVALSSNQGKRVQ